MNANCIQAELDPSDLSAQERAYAYIKGAITSSEFSPNFKLRAQEIARKLRLSRTPVREALGRLEQEGLVRKEGGWGYAVRSLTLGEILDLYRVRQVLEIEAAMEALPKVERQFLALLESKLEEARAHLKKGRVWEFLSANRGFHAAIAQITGNMTLQSMLGMISDRMQIVGALVIRSAPGRAQEILRENEAILAAFRSSKARKVAAAVRGHVKGARNSAIRFLAGSRDNLSLQV